MGFYKHECTKDKSCRRSDALYVTANRTKSALVIGRKALRNAAASNNIDDLAKNSSHQGAVDAYFSIETPRQNIQDQRSSGRCWMFSGLNVLRANFAKAHNDSMRVEFSQAYLFFYDQMEKANFMLQNVIDNAGKPIDDPRVQYFFKSPINDGGTFAE